MEAKKRERRSGAAFFAPACAALFFGMRVIRNLRDPGTPPDLRFLEIAMTPAPPTWGRFSFWFFFTPS